MALPYTYLFVPGDDAHKIGKAAGGAAGAVILDLEDSVAASRKDEALRTTREFLASRDEQADGPEFWVRLNTDDPARTLVELAALPLERVAGVFYPKLSAHDQLVRTGHWLDALEARDGANTPPTQIVGIITENAAAIVGENAASLARGHPRLRGYTWGVEDLSADLGRPPAGSPATDRQIIASVQLHCLYLAAAAGTAAIDSISTAIREPDVLAQDCDTARALGYSAKMAIHPAQVSVINEHLAPDAKTLEWARRVQALARENPEKSAFSLDGRMVDKPHIEVARRILAQAGDESAPSKA